MEAIFNLRYRIARIGSNDWMKWWDSNALTLSGTYALERVFRRTTLLTAADVAIRTARLRHDRAVPDEPLVHLFNFGEGFEGIFERWLIDQKAEGWEPDPLTQEREEDDKTAVTAALQSVDLRANGTDEHTSQNGCVVLGRLSEADLENEQRRQEWASKLVAAYTAAAPSQLVVPYFRLER